MTASTSNSGYSFSIPVAPVPAARPRVAKFGTYYPRTYATYRKDAHLWASKADLRKHLGDLDVELEVIGKRPRTTILTAPNGDVDNFAKAALDVLNDRAWGDDKQIRRLVVTKRFAEPGEEPRTDVTISEWKE